MVRANESELTVPLRKAWGITRYKRAPRAIQIIREHVIHHLKVSEDEEVWIDPSVNEKICQEVLKTLHERYVCRLLVTMNQIFQSK